MHIKKIPTSSASITRSVFISTLNVYIGELEAIKEAIKDPYIATIKETADFIEEYMRDDAKVIELITRVRRAWISSNLVVSDAYLRWEKDTKYDFLRFWKAKTPPPERTVVPAGVMYEYVLSVRGEVLKRVNDIRGMGETFKVYSFFKNNNYIKNIKFPIDNDVLLLMHNVNNNLDDVNGILNRFNTAKYDTLHVSYSMMGDLEIVSTFIQSNKIIG